MSGIYHSWNGTVLTITSDSGTSSADLQGLKGDTGIRGPQGVGGVAGLQGPQGPQGEPGPAGPAGPAGPKGEDGKMTFSDLTAEQKASLKGDKGDQGDPGPAGDPGPQGPQGEQGVQGPQGEKGEKGDPGEGGGRAAAYNLLDNSCFVNPINQRGQTSYSGAGYSIDRWKTWNSDDTLTVNDGYITITGGLYAQYIKGYANGNYSAFAKKTDGTIISLNTGYEAANDWRYVALPAGSYVWAALYEGEYTADTLPEYVYKGYAAELLECQRYYYQPLNKSAGYIVPAIFTSATAGNAAVITPVQMRIIPTITVDGFVAYTPNGTHAVSEYSVADVRGIEVLIPITTEGAAIGGGTCVINNPKLSADL